MTQNLKATNVIVLDNNSNQGTISDAIKYEVSKQLNEIIELDRGITISASPMSKQYINIFEKQEFQKTLKNMQFFDKTKSKFHR